MRTHGLGFLLGVGVTVALLGIAGGRVDLYAQRTEPLLPPDGSLIALSATAGDRQQVTVIDPRQRYMCVYHISNTGEISLRSARNLRWDLMMDAYNTGTPSPQELQTLFKTK